MIGLATVPGQAGLTAILDDPGTAALVFDFDGTLSPIVADPDKATIHPPARAALIRLAPIVGSIAILTGRPADVVVSRAGFAGEPALASLVVLGHYGRQRWDADTGRVRAPVPPPGVAIARERLPDLLRRLPLPAGVFLEDKGSALAVHTRRSADPDGALTVLRDALADFAAAYDLVIEPGRFVLELRPPGVDKGTALRAYVAERAARSVAYTGDDLGDLSAFAAVEALRRDGVAGVKICSGSAEVVQVAERADLVVDGPAGVADLFAALADRLTSSAS